MDFFMDMDSNWESRTLRGPQEGASKTFINKTTFNEWINLIEINTK